VQYFILYLFLLTKKDTNSRYLSVKTLKLDAIIQITIRQIFLSKGRDLAAVRINLNYTSFFVCARECFSVSIGLFALAFVCLL
jgi:hypothetical protein